MMSLPKILTSKSSDQERRREFIRQVSEGTISSYGDSRISQSGAGCDSYIRSKPESSGLVALYSFPAFQALICEQPRIHVSCIQQNSIIEAKCLLKFHRQLGPCYSKTDEGKGRAR